MFRPWYQLFHRWLQKCRKIATSHIWKFRLFRPGFKRIWFENKTGVTAYGQTIFTFRYFFGKNQIGRCEQKTLFQVQIYMWCSRSSTKSRQPKPIWEILIWKISSLLILFKVCSRQKKFGSGYQKALTKTQIAISPAIRWRNFLDKMACKAESTLSRRCKFSAAIHGSMSEM